MSDLTYWYQRPRRAVGQLSSIEFHMAKKKATRKKAAKKKPVEVPPEEVVPELTRRERILNAIFNPQLLIAVALIGAGYVVGPSLFKLMPDLSDREEYRLDTTDITIPDPPRWVPANLVEQVVQRAGLADDVFVLDEKLAERIALAFEQHPWVDGNATVRISVPAKIEVDFKYRQAVAMVAIGDGYYPVDGSGSLLPPADFPPSDVGLYPVIQGMHTTPDVGTGEKWGDPRIVGAARLAVVLFPHWADWSLQAIEVPPRDSREMDYENMIFTITTEGGSRIIWGRAPGHDHPLEITEEQKIGRVKEFLAKGKTFDGAWEININHLMEISRRPLDG
jgi:hypothetical protein